MAVVFVEGFDTYNGTGGATATTVGTAVRWTGASVSLSSSVTPFSSGQSLVITMSTGSHYAYTGVSPNTSGTLGFAFLMTRAPDSSSELVGFYSNSSSGGGRQFSLMLTSAGALSIAVNTNTTPTTIYTTPNNLTPSTWNYIEVEFTIANSATVNIYVNGTLFGSASGIDTQSQAGSTYNILYFGNQDTSTYGTTFYFDNIYLTDTPSRLGEQRVVTVLPTSDSTPSQWSASGGAVAPYTMVDEALCNADVDYIFDGTIGDRAVFNMASTDLTPVTVNAVQLGTYSRKTDSGVRSIQLQYVDGGGTGYSSSDIALGSSYTRQLSVLETNPATSTAWTPTEANNLKVGVRISA